MRESGRDGGVRLRTRAARVVRQRWRRLRALSAVVAQTAVAAAVSWVLASRVFGNPEPVSRSPSRWRRPWPPAATAAVVGQSAASAVLIATLTPPSEGIYVSRVVDALIGGAVALVVMAVLLPVNPLTVVSRVAKPALGVLIDGLRGAARGLRERDDNFAHDALRQYLDAAEYIERSIRNARVLARRTVTLLRDGEPAPPQLGEAVAALAEAAKVIRRDLGRGHVIQGIVVDGPVALLSGTGGVARCWP
ncbi:hypothetical protein KIF24_24665 [Micromonospora sp. Llam7]|uniref:hypothetical protein n=1 Tax=Micromonospora tarapacensis TaxID=2835305 RepID=UPI001C82C8B5|nr:hypothetical protein [Micromonospora tarapacensis]MBX7268907.1 hypothetical protein [Micromonospora tarapacensis]